MTRTYCDRCKKEITGIVHGKGTIHLAVNNSNHESWQGAIKLVYCYSCTKTVEKFLREN